MASFTYPEKTRPTPQGFQVSTAGQVKKKKKLLILQILEKFQQRFTTSVPSSVTQESEAVACQFAWTIPFCPLTRDNEGELRFPGSIRLESRKSGLNDLPEVTQAVVTAPGAALSDTKF